jgi:hypothetical protein
MLQIYQLFLKVDMSSPVITFFNNVLRDRVSISPVRIQDKLVEKRNAIYKVV